MLALVAVFCVLGAGRAVASSPPDTIPPIVAPVPADPTTVVATPANPPSMPEVSPAVEVDRGFAAELTAVLNNLPGATAVPGTADAADPDGGNTATIGIDVPGADNASNVVVVILLLTVLSVAPSVLIMMTSFTRIVVVLSLTRNALGIPQLPPQQIIVGLSLFLTMFVMGPTLSELNDVALQPLLAGSMSVTEAADAASGPMREFMLSYTREPELELFLDASQTATPIARDEVPLTALIPAFMLSELKSAFILGFIIFVPFLVIDLVVSAVLTSLGMMMLPPTFVSLPMKLLLFILLDGWALVVGTLLRSYR
ncbi:MAG TPA: flagellar type III secretion system pore protein FliP [Ilumatobacter sp.]|nr:flagellar type III secretion system pore protein FliP [Ilumatobacter sp.]